jgi:hypothetical protein
MNRIAVAVALVAVAVIMWFTVARAGRDLPRGDAAGVALQQTTLRPQPARAPSGGEQRWGQ